MSVLDQITGLIPVAIGAGLVMKVVEKTMPQQSGVGPKRNGKGKKRTRRTSSLGFGDFSNVGL